MLKVHLAPIKLWLALLRLAWRLNCVVAGFAGSVALPLSLYSMFVRCYFVGFGGVVVSGVMDVPALVKSIPMSVWLVCCAASAHILVMVLSIPSFLIASH